MTGSLRRTITAGSEVLAIEDLLRVDALAVAPDGALFGGGVFQKAGGKIVNNIAKWDSSVWSLLGSGMDSVVKALAVAPGGVLYAGGEFKKERGMTVNHIAKWDGAAWLALGTGMDGSVYALAVSMDGTLYAGGLFQWVDGKPANYVAKWGVRQQPDKQNTTYGLRGQ